MTELIHYDAAVREIALAHSVDEVKDIRDKAMALEIYAKQAMNTDMERKATEIRIRAERKTGQMLEEINPGRGGDHGHRHLPKDQREPLVKSEYATAKQHAGISDTQAKRWQRLAAVPDPDFEDALGDEKIKPSTTGIIKKANGSSSKMDPKALWLWGRMRDFERDLIL